MPLKTSELLVAAFKAGANKVEDVQFYTSELRRYRDEARAMAMKAAQEKAQALASAGGARLGCVMNIDEQSWSYYSGYWWNGRNSAQMTQNVTQEAAEPQSGPEDTPISPGHIAVRAEVNANFSLQ